jgi:ABC-2 type transport system ATP-binding protein
MAFDIQITGLRKSFGNTVAVDDLSLEVREGEMLGLIGPDGAGKTTTLRIVCGLLLADSGTCLVGGRAIRSETRTVRSFLGYMPQRFSLYPDLTVAENLRFFADLFQVEKKEREARLARLLEFSRLGPFSKRRAAALSGGMKQKLALSCTLIHTPKILLLDEPTTGVDPVSRREFWDILAGLRAEGVTILVTTPYMDEAARCSRVAFIYKGKIMIESLPENIPGMFKKVLLEIKTQENARAAKILADSKAFHDVQSFGDRLHVSGTGGAADLSKKAKELIQGEGIQMHSIQQVEASIEDVFVELLK